MAWYDPTTWFSDEPAWISNPAAVLPAGPYRELIFLRNDIADAFELANKAASGGFRIVQFRAIKPIPGYEQYINFHGYVTADLAPRPISALNAVLGPGVGVVAKASAGMLDQTKLEGIWDTGLVTGQITGEVSEGAVEAARDVLESLTEETAGIAQRAAEGAGAGFWKTIPWVGLAIGAGGIGALVYYLRRKKR